MLQISDEHSDLLFFNWPISHLGNFAPPSGKEGSEGFIWILTGGFQISGSDIKFLVVRVIINENSNNIFPGSGFGSFKCQKPGENSFLQGLREQHHQVFMNTPLG